MTVVQSVDPPASPGLLARIRRALARDSHLSLMRRFQKGLQFAGQLARAHRALKDCNEVGASARVAGRMRVQNRGSIVIGQHLNINSSWVPTELLTGPEGHIQIGDDVLINFGTVIAAAKGVAIGSGTMIGPYCIISDVDIPESATNPGPVAAKPIEIGRDVWIAGRVTLLPGVRIGDGAVVVAGSIVEQDVPAQVMASGIPARLLPKFGTGPAPAHGAPIAVGPTPAPIAVAAVTGLANDAVMPRLAGAVISDFSLDELVHELVVADSSPPLDATLVPHGSPALSLAGVPRAAARDFAIVWTRPETVIPAFGRLVSGMPVDERQLASEVDAFCGLVEQTAKSYRYVLLVTWTQPAYLRGLGVFDGRPGGVMSALSAMNLRMTKSMERRPNVLVLHAARWQSAVGPASFNPRAWYLGGMAAARPLIVEAARDIRAAIAALYGQQRKLLVLDAGAMLWDREPGGASASPLEQAYADFQQSLQLLRGRGVMLGLLGKMKESALAQAIDSRPGQLKSADFAACGEAGDDTAASLNALAVRLGVAPEAVVYVDTQQSVRARVSAALPAVFVPDWPADKMLFPTALQDLRCFDTADTVADRVAATQ